MITTTFRHALLIGCALPLLASAQNTFFNQYNLGSGGSFETVMRCANGDLVCTDYYWNRMMRTDSLGNVLWTRNAQMNPVLGSGAPVETGNGDLLLLASHYDTATTRQHIALVRLDAEGNVLAADAFNVDTLSFYPWRHVPLSNGMIAHIATALNAQEVVIMVFDPSGPYAYPRIRIPVSFPLQGNAPAGFTGVFAGQGGTFFTYHGSYQPTLILSKYQHTGALYWSKSYAVDGHAYTIGMAGAMLAGGNLALLVEAVGGPPNNEYVLLLDPMGNVIAARQLHDPDNAFDWEGDVVPMPDGSFVVHLRRTVADPDEENILVHLDANADVIAQYGLETDGFVKDAIAVDNGRLALAGWSNNKPTLSVMPLNGELPTCWVADSVTVTPVVATASNATYTSSTYLAPALPAAYTALPQANTSGPQCSSVGLAPVPPPAFALFPNPSHDGRYTLQGEGLAAGDLFQVFNAQGIRCAEGRLPADARLDLAQLAPGGYVLRVLGAARSRAVRFVR